MPSLQLNLEGGQLFCLTEGKGPHEWPGYCRQYLFSLGVVTVLMLIHTFQFLPNLIVDTDQDEDKSNLFFFSDLGFLAELQIPLHCIFPDLSMHMILPF